MLLTTTNLPDDTVYASNYRHIIYYLLEKDCPTKYVHPSLMLRPSYIKAYGMDINEELNSILRQQPTFIVMQAKYDLPKSMTKEDYILIKEFPKEVRTYQLN